jgi:transposase
VPLRKALPEILSSNTDVLSPRMIGLIADLMQDWRQLDERIEVVSTEIEALAQHDNSCQRLMAVPGVGPIISSAVVAAIGNGAGFQQGLDFTTIRQLSRELVIGPYLAAEEPMCGFRRLRPGIPIERGHAQRPTTCG